MLNKTLQKCNAAQYISAVQNYRHCRKKIRNAKEREKLWNNEDKGNNGDKITGKGKTCKKKRSGINPLIGKEKNGHTHKHTHTHTHTLWHRSE